jgi:hypothetical protein
MRLADGFPQRRPGFDPSSCNEGFMVDEIALRQVFSVCFDFPCQFSLHQLLPIRLSFSGAGSGRRTKWIQWKRRVQQLFYSCVCIRYRSNVFTELLPSNDMGNFIEPLPSNDRGIFTEPLPRNDKGIFTEPLPSNDRGDTQTHTHRQQCDLISLLYFFKIRKIG